jgi:hypothetical protein
MDDQFGTHICTSEIGNRAVKLRALLDWIGPVAAGAGVAGVFFIWLSGRQGRNHVSQLAASAETRADRERLRNEQRETPISVFFDSCT